VGTTANCNAVLQAALTADAATAWYVNNTGKTNITAAADNGSGYCRITSPGHGLSPIFGNTTVIAGVTGANATAINGTRTATVIDQNTFDLLAVPFSAVWGWTAATSTPNNGVTYNFMPPDNPAVSPALATTFPVPYSYVDIDVTPLMAAAITSNTSGKVGFRIFTQSTQTVDICSAFSYGGAIPQLIIQTTNAPAISITSPAVNPAFIYVNSGLRITAAVAAIPATAANLTSQWTQVSGTGTASFTSPGSPSTNVTFSTPGDYVLRLSANDGVLQSYKDITVRVLKVSVTGPTDHLVLRLPFDETSGTIATDVSGVTPTNSGTLITGLSSSLPVWSSTGGKIGGALLLSGSGQQVVVPDSSTNQLDGMSQLSISCWFYNNATIASSSSYNAIICKRATGTTNGESYTIKLRGGTPPTKIYFDVNNKSSGASSAGIYTGKWYHLVMVFDGTLSTQNLKFYINGSPDTFGTIYSSGTTVLQTSVPRNAATALHIGAQDSADTVGWNGLIDEVRVYNKALTLAEVQDLYTAAPANMGPTITTSSTVSGSAGQPFPLAATVTDDGFGGTLTVGWSTISGPGSATFENPAAATTNATCVLGGTFTLRLTASDGTIATFADVSANITGKAFASWASAQGLTGPNAASTANPSGDGINNLMKYALGLDPNKVCTTLTDGTNAGLPRVSTDASTLSLTYQRDTTKTDITYLVEAGTDLTSWSSSSITEQILSNGTIQTVKASAPRGSNPKEFIRLRVTK